MQFNVKIDLQVICENIFENGSLDDKIKFLEYLSFFYLKHKILEEEMALIFPKLTNYTKEFLKEVGKLTNKFERENNGQYFSQFS